MQAEKVFTGSCQLGPLSKKRQRPSLGAQTHMAVETQSVKMIACPATRTLVLSVHLSKINRAKVSLCDGIRPGPAATRCVPYEVGEIPGTRHDTRLQIPVANIALNYKTWRDAHHRRTP